MLKTIVPMFVILIVGFLTAKLDLIAHFVSRRISIQRIERRFCLPLFFFVTFVLVPSSANSQSDSLQKATVSGEDSSLIILSDTQFASWFQFWDENNARWVEAVIREAEHRPANLVLFLGDVTNHGSSVSEWRRFDTLTSVLFSKVPRRIAALGNHDYFGSNRTALDNFFSRFPDLNNRQWSEHHWNQLGIVLLNSNFSELSRDEQRDQQAWLEETLHKFDSDPEVVTVLVGFHHSPYSNSVVVGSNEEAQQNFLPIIRKSRKVSVIISGHAHTYEHFFIEGRDYIVAGGCGPHHPVNVNVFTRDFDDLYHGNRIRPHHFCTIRRSGSSFIFEMHQLDEGNGTWTVGDSLKITPLENP